MIDGDMSAESNGEIFRFDDGILTRGGHRTALQNHSMAKGRKDLTPL